MTPLCPTIYYLGKSYMMPFPKLPSIIISFNVLVGFDKYIAEYWDISAFR